ncbi:MAG: sugar transferase [Phenylobacterium sp.]|uniref:sugar transferase n=1 Tax=Phenylobacterium sp. TaxID=1871053 RepID=UPI003BB50D1C
MDFWVSSQANLTHVTINLICSALAAAYASRLRGTLEFKMGQALTATVAIFGFYAVAILIGRLFFSRSMFAFAVVGAACVSILVVGLRHRLTRARVAIISPLVGEMQFSFPFARIVSDPSKDLRGFDIVLVSLNENVSADWARALSRAMLAGCKIRHVGQYMEELSGAVSLEHFEVEHLPPNGIASYQLIKRLMDIAMVVFILPMALPIILLSSLAVLLTTGRPIFFLQERVGLGGVPFRMWKLRTMRPELKGETLRAAVVGDSRVTPVGRILRRFRIDELPQFWNVLKGDMSLIGPRPEATPLHIEYLGKLPNYPYRYLVRPGITGWAQVNSPPSASADEARRKLTYDLFYVKNLSLFLDLQIIAKTFWTVTSGGGVR